MDLSSFDLNLLKVLEALYLEKTVTRAAKRLDIAQSSLSSSLKRLRTIFGDELFVRSPDGMQPTAKAIEIEPIVMQCLKNARQAVFPSKELDIKNSTRKYVIGGTDFSAFTILPSLINLLKKEAPQTRLEMKPCLPDEVISFLDNGIFDFAIRAGKNIPKRFIAEQLFEEDMVVIARKNHPILKDKKRITLEDYTSLQHLYITSKGEGEQLIDNALKKHSFQRDIFLKVQNFLIAPYIVENSDLVTTISERVAYHCSQRSRLEIIPFPLEIEKNTFHILWSKTINSDLECMWLINSIIKIMKTAEKPHL